MPKQSSHSTNSKSSSRALRRLEPYNKSPVSQDDRQHGSRHSSGKKSHRSKSSRSRSKSRGHSRSRSPAEPPQWAKVLIRNQEEAGKELKRLQGEIERGRAASSSKPAMARVPEPSFRYVGNKTQYELNNSVVDKIETALATNDEEKRTAVLNEGKSLLSERNKHILLAEKFGWDAVECYTAEPLATDADDEKRIRKAVKESKRLRDEKKKKFMPSHKAARKPVSWTGNSEPKRGLDRSPYPPSHGFSAGKPSMTRNTSPVCFRCLRPGHFARDCRAASGRTVTFNGLQPGAVPQQPASQ